MDNSRSRKGRRTGREYLPETPTEELLEELVHRRKDALMDCSTQEIEAELLKRGVERECPPRLVEK